MSSFVINKVEYEKAGGFVAGLMSEFRECGLWNPEAHSYADRDCYRKWFVECYEMNAESVAEQYGDELVVDEDVYEVEFMQYYDYGKTVAVSRENLRQSLAELYYFFRSSLYQTEKKEYSDKMELLYKRIIFNLIKELFKGIQTDSWGEFRLKKPEYRYERII